MAMLKRSGQETNKLKILSRVDYSDVFSEALPGECEIQDVLRGFFLSTPLFVRVMMRIRNFLLARVGLKSTSTPTKLNVKRFKEGDQIGVFNIGVITPTYALMGADDRHLDFRVRLEIKDRTLVCSTEVQFKMNLGRIYFFVVKPFHRIVVPAMLKAMIRDLKK
jgi:hypothetical protein